MVEILAVLLVGSFTSANAALAALGLYCLVEAARLQLTTDVSTTGARLRNCLIVAALVPGASILLRLAARSIIVAMGWS